MKRILAVLLALTMALSLAACGGKEGEWMPTGPSSTTPQGSQTTPPSGGPGTSDPNQAPDTGETPEEPADIDMTNMTDGQLDEILQFTEDGEGYSVTKLLKTNILHVTIPATYRGKPVLSIATEAFMDCTVLQSVTFPEGLQSILYDAFAGCTGLKNLHIPSTVTEINKAFRGCSGLESLTVDPDSETYESIDNCVIEKQTRTMILGCKNSVIPEGLMMGIRLIVGKIDGAFDGCRDLTEIVIPDGIREISYNSFRDCENLKNLHIPASVEKIATGAFRNCSGLESITVDPENTRYYSQGNCLLETAYNSLMLGCKNSVIPEGTAWIGDSAFLNCDIETVVIPDSVTSLGWSAFDGCQKLKNITLSKNAEKIECYTFMNCTALEEIVIPEGVVNISSMVFTGCSALKTVVLPASAVKIDGFLLFDNCDALEKLVFTRTDGWLDTRTQDANGNYASANVTDPHKNAETVRNAGFIWTRLADN